MADKEATVYIVDLGSSMGDCNNGRVESNLDFGMRYVWDKLATTTAASRKTWGVGVLGLSTEETKHDLTGDEGYDNISVLKELDMMLMSHLKSLKQQIKPSDNSSGDALSAIIVAIDMITKYAPKRLKFKRKIILVTDGQGPLDADDFDDVSNQINDLGIELVILGIDFDDAEYGFKEEDKSSAKAENERLFHKLVGQCNDGVIGTMAEAVGELEKPRLKSTRPFKSYDGTLTLGDPKKYDSSALSINVERYFMTKIARPPPASNVVLRPEAGGGATQSTETLDDMDIDDDDGFAAVKQARNYTIKVPANKDEPDGKRDVAFEDLSKGFTYGRTAVYIGEEEKNITQIDTEKGFAILGFIQGDRYEPMLNLGETCCIISRKHSEKDELSLSALIHTLYETESLAVARLVAKDKKEPELLLLMPSIEPGFECLYDVPLPFAEDVRPYRFPPLDKVVTITGATLTKHHLLPTDDLNQAMSDYVDAMDISEYDVDEDGNPAQYAPLEDSFSPMIHRVNQAIRFRALNPDKPFEPAEGGVLERFSKPPEDLVQKKKPEIEALIKAADIKKVDKKVKSRFAWRNRNNEGAPLKVDDAELRAMMEAGAAPVSGKRVSELSGQQQPAKITIENAIPAFKQALEAAKDDDEIANYVQQMGDIVRELVKTSPLDSNRQKDQALENMSVMRKTLRRYELPTLYNDFLRMLKGEIAKGELGGEQSYLWNEIRFEGMGLITTEQCEASSVSNGDAAEFLSPPR